MITKDATIMVRVVAGLLHEMTSWNHGTTFFSGFSNSYDTEYEPMRSLFWMYDNYFTNHKYATLHIPWKFKQISTKKF
jgi:dTDP-4-dehydrorhamnose 3,5-epimerase-like enzyme